ncbi:MAG: twin-arginine translocase subunit TatC [Actinomycetota bacterium]|nr:twin-arginine translocase subunit TatC [Actinomycetota bacterium]
MTTDIRRGSSRLHLPRRQRKQRLSDGRMPLVEHLRELRHRLIVIAAVLVVGMVVAYALYPSVLAELFFGPYCLADIPRPGADDTCQLISLGVADQFVTRLRISLIAAILAAAPVWLYQAGAFISPGLHRHERRWAMAFGAAGLLLFGVGVVFAYLSLPRGLEFLLTQGQSTDAGSGQIVPFLDARKYVDFLTLTLTAFGVAFLFPLFVVFGHLVGVLPLERLVAWRRGVIFGIFVSAAVITPTQDPVTFLFMAVPLIVLYEGCILLARVRERLRRRRAASRGEDYDALDDDEASPLVDEPGPAGRPTSR